MSLLDEDVVFAFRIWGYAITGDVGQVGALVAELRPGDATFTPQVLWDRTGRDLAGSFVDKGDGWRRAPEHWALPWVTEHRMRLEMAGR